MNKKQIIEHAKGYMDLLAQGIDPITQQEAATEPRLQKCFTFVAGILDELLTNNGYVDLSSDGGDGSSAPQYELVRKKEHFSLSQEQRRRVFIEKTPITPTAFVNHINKVIDDQAMEKLSVKSINAWLLKNAYVTQTKQSTTILKTVMTPSSKAASIGIGSDETADPKTGEIKRRLTLTYQAQMYLLNNLDSILAASEEISQ